MKKLYFLAVLLPLLLISCVVTKKTSDPVVIGEKPNTTRINEIEPDENNLSLLNYLRRQPGLSISGNENNPTIYIRGVNSISNQQPPLFVVDGRYMGRSYTNIVAMVEVNDIQRIKVLRTASETNTYGMQGSQGVIEITTKKGK